MARPPLPPTLRRLLGTATLLLAGSCGLQGEGQRCDTLNGNADCESGLVCTPAEDLNPFPGNEKGAAICCPSNGQATVEACFPRDFGGLGDGGGLGGASGAGGADASTPDSGTRDGG
jgi:hypothetical protein